MDERTGRRKWLVIVGCLLILITGCRSKLDKVREGFIDGCKSSGATTSMCKCSIDKLQAHYGDVGLLAIEERGQPPSDFFEQLAQAGQQCKEE